MCFLTSGEKVGLEPESRQSRHALHAQDPTESGPLYDLTCGGNSSDCLNSGRAQVSNLHYPAQGPCGQQTAVAAGLNAILRRIVLVANLGARTP